MNDQELADLLRSARTIAVVGLSDKSWRASNGVSRYMQSAGYRVIPVNPRLDEALGERAYPSLEALPEKPDIIDVFRRSENIPELVDPALGSGATLFWMQQGITHPDAAEKLRQGGMKVVEDRCLMVEHRRLLG